MIISFSVSRNFGGYDISARSFFSALNELSGTQLSSHSPPCRSSICEARQKLSWEAFPYLLDKFNDGIKAELDSMKWRGHSVYAIDGSTLRLTFSDALKQRFPDVGSGQTKTHYPKARIVLATHVFSGIPKSLRVDDQFVGERSMMHGLLGDIEDNSVLLLDRGFDGVASLKKIIDSNKNFVCRLRSELWSSTEVYLFTKSKAQEKIVSLKNKHDDEIQVRLLKYKKDRNGNWIVLATNLFNQDCYPKSELWDLYSRRWEIETAYYRVKTLFQVEKFHSKKINGVLQEIWGSLLALAMNSYLIMRSWGQKMRGLIKSKKAANFKNATVVFERNFAGLLFPSRMGSVEALIEKITNEIASVLFLRQFGRKNPRISKQPLSTWVGGRKNKTKNKIGRSKVRRGIYA